MTLTMADRKQIVRALMDQGDTRRMAEERVEVVLASLHIARQIRHPCPAVRVILRELDKIEERGRVSPGLTSPLKLAFERAGLRASA